MNEAGLLSNDVQAISGFWPQASERPKTEAFELEVIEDE